MSQVQDVVRVAVASVFVALAASSTRASTWFVDATSAPGSNGASWASAFNRLD